MTMMMKSKSTLLSLSPPTLKVVRQLRSSRAQLTSDHTDAMNVEANAEVNLEADTSIGAFRPSRRAAVEATKKIEATKANIKDNATKENKSKGKGKGKAKAVSSEEDSDEEEEVVRPKQKKVKKVKEEILSEESDFEDIKPKVGGKKQVLAKAVYWKDIPKWEKGSGSLLMGLPGDVMDIIFGLREELGVSQITPCIE